MKKEYIAPEVEKIVFGSACRLLEGSPEDNWADAKDNNIQTGDDDDDWSGSVWED